MMTPAEHAGAIASNAASDVRKLQDRVEFLEARLLMLEGLLAKTGLEIPARPAPPEKRGGYTTFAGMRKRFVKGDVEG
jgi:hypothetical protein